MISAKKRRIAKLVQRQDTALSLFPQQFEQRLLILVGNGVSDDHQVEAAGLKMVDRLGKAQSGGYVEAGRFENPLPCVEQRFLVRDGQKRRDFARHNCEKWPLDVGTSVHQSIAYSNLQTRDLANLFCSNPGLGM